MHHAVQATLEFIKENSGWTFPVVFFVSFGESFVFVSFMFPGTTVMLAAGALVPTGALPLWPVLLGAILGAVLGDSISYALGRRYGHLLDDRWPFTRYPTLLPRGYAFFDRHGAKSVFVGRFFGPLRAVIPLVAGVAKMPRARFWIANVLSALVWAPALLVPGVLATLAIDEIEMPNHWRAAFAALFAVLALGAYVFMRRRGLFGAKE